MDQLQYIGLLGVLAGRFDDDFHRASIGKQTQSAPVPLGKSQGVEHFVGLLDIEPCPTDAKRAVVKRALREDRIIALGTEPVIENLVNLMAVYAERKGPPELDVPEQASPNRVRHVQIRK